MNQNFITWVPDNVCWAPHRLQAKVRQKKQRWPWLSGKQDELTQISHTIPDEWYWEEDNNGDDGRCCVCNAVGRGASEDDESDEIGAEDPPVSWDWGWFKWIGGCEWRKKLPADGNKERDEGGNVVCGGWEKAVDCNNDPPFDCRTCGRWRSTFSSRSTSGWQRLLIQKRTTEKN